MFKYVFQDWKYNDHDFRIRTVLSLFRLSQYLWQKGGVIRAISFPYFTIYRILVVWIFGIELCPYHKIGCRLKVFHGYALVIHPRASIGDDVILRHCTTLGNRKSSEVGPKIGNRVNIGCNSVIIGDINIGDDVTIGAGSVVNKEVLSGTVVAGNPARIIHSQKNKQ